MSEMKEGTPLQILWTLKELKKEYYEQLYTHKFENLDEMDQFLKGNNLSKLTQEEIDSPNRPISIKEIESIVNNLPNRKHEAQMGSLVNSTKHLKKKLYQFSTISFRG